jgi:outer membrane usher protein
MGIMMTSFCASKASGSEAVGGAGTAAKEIVSPVPAAAQAALTINLALKDGKFYLGEVPTRINGDVPVSVERESFLKAGAPVLSAEVTERVRELPADSDFVRLDTLKEASLAVTFDMSQMTLSVNPTVEQRPKGHISLSSDNESGGPDRFSKQSAVSGFINLNGAAQYSGATSTTGKAGITETLGTAAAIRILNLVIENEATFATGSAVRQGTRVVYDDPDHALRYTIGDITPSIVGLQGGSSFFGFAIQKSYAKLQPQKNIRPTGQRTFRLERPSEVDIIVNGQTVRRLQMPPGDHDISELPLKSGENVLKLDITDDTGQHTVLEFTVFFNHTLLSPGISEWGLAGGVTSTIGLNGVTYNWGNPAATAYYQTGLSEDLTGTAHIQADGHAIMAGLMGVRQSSLGLFSIEAAASARWDGTPGAATSLSYTPETLLKTWQLPGLAQIAMNYRSAYFSPILATVSGPGLFSIDGFYSVPLADDLALSLSANASTGENPSYGGSISLTRTIKPDLSWGLTASYEHAPEISGAGGVPSWSAVARLSWKPGKDSQFSYTLDKATGKAQAEVSTQERTSDGSYSVKAQMENDPGTPPGSAPQEQTNVSANYSGSRFNLAASFSKQVVQGGTTLGNVSVISGAGAIAFADDHIAFGRPVTDSFAIVAPHPSLQDATIQVAPGGKGARGVSDAFGNALVSDLSSYSNSQLPVQVDGAPDGYDLGSGLFEVRPSYKSGYVLQVGSDYSVTVIGILEDKSKPLALLSGIAREGGVSEPRKVVIFTNGDGRFAAEGLKPGLWRIELLSEPPACFALKVPDGTAGLFDAGKLAQRCVS